MISAPSEAMYIRDWPVACCCHYDDHCNVRCTSQYEYVPVAVLLVQGQATIDSTYSVDTRKKIFLSFPHILQPDYTVR
jgi:hypothetical protein